MEKKVVIQGLWVGERLPTMQQISIASFLAHGHEFHLYTYSELPGIPAGTVVKDAEEIIPSSRIFKNVNRNTYAAFSDFFRYKLLLDKGGWWVDVDTICLRPFQFDADYVFSSQHQLARERVNSGIIKAPAGCELMAYTWDVCNSKDRTKLEWDEVGPDLMEAAVGKFALERYVRPAVAFCPLAAYEWRALVEPEWRFVFEKSTYGIHLWHEMWRYMRSSVDLEFAPDCLYEQFKALYLRGESLAGRNNAFLVR